MPAVRSKGNKIQGAEQGDLPIGDGANTFAKPFVKWAGGKTQLLPQLAAFYPKGNVDRYIEPFLGSGAVFFDVKAKVTPRHVLLWDNNQELIDTFVAVRDNVEQVIRLLQGHERRHIQDGKDYFLAMRTKLRKNLPEVAARLIYLNKTCFNGLYRVNSKGEFNVPFGRYPKPSILNKDGLRRASEALAGAQIEPWNFLKLLLKARRGDFIYFDPPYHPLSATSYFTSYTKDAFSEEDQRDLADVYRALDERGCLLMLSNSNTKLINSLYQGFEIKHVNARRNINSKWEKRGPIKELVILNRHLLEASNVRG
jgi:DNA adenine methylase